MFPKKKYIYQIIIIIKYLYKKKGNIYMEEFSLLIDLNDMTSKKVFLGIIGWLMKKCMYSKLFLNRWR